MMIAIAANKNPAPEIYNHKEGLPGIKEGTPEPAFPYCKCIMPKAAIARAYKISANRVGKSCFILVDLWFRLKNNI